MNHLNQLMRAAFALLLLAGAKPMPAQGPPDEPVDMVELKKSGKPPKPIKQSPPEYPREMSRAGLIGVVRVGFVIDKEGNVRNPYVVESNNPWFERPAVDAILKWKFQPAEMNGRPVNTRAIQPLDFRLFGQGREPELWQVSKAKDHDKLPAEFRWDTPPTPVSTMFPVYPFEQLKAGTEGEARISYIVGPDGRVVGAKLREASTPEFGQAVLAMIDAWRFRPAKKKDGKPAYANLGGEYRFRTNGRGDVPVSDEARWILEDLEKKPAAIVKAAELDQPLKPLSRRPPAYPTALKEAGQLGGAEIEFLVDKNGDAQLPRIISSTAPEFGYAAAQAVATWRFEVPKKGGKPVVVGAQVPITFALRDQKPAENKKTRVAPAAPWVLYRLRAEVLVVSAPAGAHVIAPMMNRRLLLPLVLLALGLPLGAAAQSTGPKPGYTVILDVKMDEEGVAEDAVIFSSDDTTLSHDLERAALATAKDLKLAPRLKDGHAVAFTVRAPYVFPVEGDEGPDANNAPKPKIAHAVQPVYPAELAANGTVGGAILEAVIGADGKIESLMILRSSHPAFELAATTAVKQWQFVPAQKDGAPVESRWRLAISFETDVQATNWAWRVPPRPSLGNYTVVHRTLRQEAPATPPPSGTPAPEKK